MSLIQPQRLAATAHISALRRSTISAGTDVQHISLSGL